MKIKQITIIGIGLIGGSLARALKRAEVVDRIVACAGSEAELIRAQELGVIDSYELDPAEAVKGSEIVMIAIPLGVCEGIFDRIAPSLAAETIITDAGSVKGSVIEAVRVAMPEHLANFVPGHPIAGTEKSGVEASFCELYDNHHVILTPIKETNPVALERICQMWQAAGAEVDLMSVERHDEVLAATSHLPHVMAYSLVNTLSKMEESGDVFRFAAGGFADFTRIASSSPQMWHDIVFANRTAVLDLLERYEQGINDLKHSLENDDSDYVLKMLSEAKQARDRFADNRNKRRVSPKTETGEE